MFSLGRKGQKSARAALWAGDAPPPPKRQSPSPPQPARRPVAVRASDNEVDVDAIVKDIQAKGWEGMFGGPRRGRPTARARERGWLGPHGAPPPLPGSGADADHRLGGRQGRPRAASARRHPRRARAQRRAPFATPTPHPTPTPPHGEAVDDKPSAVLYAGGAVVLLWLASTVVGAVNAIPLVPKLLELVGLGYTAWFVYRYLLFKSSREELLADIEELKKKITS